MCSEESYVNQIIIMDSQIEALRETIRKEGAALYKQGQVDVLNNLQGQLDAFSEAIVIAFDGAAVSDPNVLKEILLQYHDKVTEMIDELKGR